MYKLAFLSEAAKTLILAELKALWKAHGLPGTNFADFEAALVRWGIGHRRKRQKLKR
jgi:hypothetical protein